MEGHKYFISGIPLALWKEFRQACLSFDTTAKDHLISCMQTLVIRYHRKMHEMQHGPIYEHTKEKKE